MTLLWLVKTFVCRKSLAVPMRLVTRSDGEQSILAWKTHVAAGSTKSNGIEVVREESPVGGSQGHGLSRHAIRVVEAKIRS